MKNDLRKNDILLNEEEKSFSTASFPFKEELFDAVDVAHALLDRPGRFLSPLSQRERLQLHMASFLRTIDFFHFGKFFHFAPKKNFFPHSWQVLLRYLKREGILREVHVNNSLLRNDFPYAFFYDLTSEIAVRRKNGEKIIKTMTGWGTGLSQETALSKAVGELLERTFLAQPFSWASFSPQELRTKRISFLSPQALSQFSEEQKEKFSRFRISADQKLSWTKGRALFSQKEVLIPTQVIIRGYDFGDSEPILRDTNSNGSAGHFTLKEALLAGIYENVERDSFLVYWLNTIAPPVLDTSSIKHPELQALLQKLERYRFEVKFLNTTTDIGIPSFLCVLIDRSEKGPRVAIGGGSGFDIEQVLVEIGYKTMISFQNIYIEQQETLLPDHYVPFSARNLHKRDRVLLWQNPLMFPRILPFLEGKTQTLEEAFPDLPVLRSFEEEYQYVTKLFQSLGTGYEIYFYEVKHRVLDTLGYHVVKVVIPELIHLYLNEAFAPLGARRLKDVPVKLGYTPSAQWNPWPHPFP